MDIAAMACWLAAGVGVVMVLGAIMFRAMKRLLRLSDEAVADPWFRKSDTSGLSLAVHWLKPGLVLMLGFGVLALLLEAIA